MRRYLALLVAMVALAAPGQPVPAQQAGKAAAASARWTSMVVRTPEGGYRQGNPNAPIKLVEYGSRTCPTCARFAAEGMEPLRREWIASGKLSYEFRDLLIHGAPDLSLALLNQCVPAGRFFPVLDAIFANQPAFTAAVEQLVEKSPDLVAQYQQLPPGAMATRFAERLGAIGFLTKHGVPEAQARKCLGDPALIKRIAETNAGAAALGVQSTPSFLINGRRVRAYSWDQLQPELRAAEI